MLTFGALAAYTKRLIQQKADDARRANKTLPTQEPAESLFRVQSSLELARFKDKPSAPVRVFVEPEEATAVGTAGIRGYNEWKRVWERQAEKPSPLGVPVEWELSSTVYKIEIEARGFENWAKKVEVIGPMELHADLVPKPSAPVGRVRGVKTRAGSRGWTRSHAADERSDSPDGAELAAGRLGELVVHARDRYARIEVFGADGKRVEAAWERLDKMLPVGTYRVEIALPTERPVVQSVLVTADEPEVIDVRPDPQLTQRLPASAGMIQPQDGMSVPSEAFGLATTTHLGSLLAWAASAAQYDPGGDGQKLRALGVEPFAAGPGRVLRACPRRRCAGTRAEPAGRTDRDAAPRHEWADGGAEAAARARGIRDAMARAGGVSHEPHVADRRTRPETPPSCRSSRVTCGRS